MQQFLLTLWNSVLQPVVVAIVGALAGAFALRTWQRITEIWPGKRLWDLREPEKLAICVSASQEECGDYPLRAGTSGGQIRALGLALTSLHQVYSVPNLMRNILLSTDQMGRHIEKDIILLGGPEYNSMTERLLEQLQGVPVHQSDHVITWTGRDSHPPVSYAAELKGGNIVRDYGFVMRIANPFNNGRTTIVVLSGCHAYGTLAAAYYFVEIMPQEIHWRMKSKRNFAAIVGSIIVDDWPAKPQLIKYAEWDDNPHISIPRHN